GTPRYMAPELLRGEPARPAADVYALALVACELLGGDPERRPAAGGEPAPPRLPEAIAPPHVREALERVLARALDVEPAARYPAAPRLAVALAGAALGERHAPPAGLPARGACGAAGAGEAERAEGEDAPPVGTSRVATVLHLRFEAVRPPAPPDRPDPPDPDDETRPLDTGELGELEGLERIARELGGAVITCAAGELVALFGAPRALGDDVVRAARAAHALIERCTGARAGLDTGRVELAPAPGAAPACGAPVDRARELA